MYLENVVFNLIFLFRIFETLDKHQMLVVETFEGYRSAVSLHKLIKLLYMTCQVVSGHHQVYM